MNETYLEVTFRRGRPIAELSDQANQARVSDRPEPRRSGDWHRNHGPEQGVGCRFESGAHGARVVTGHPRRTWPTSCGLSHRPGILTITQHKLSGALLTF